MGGNSRRPGIYEGYPGVTYQHWFWGLLFPPEWANLGRSEGIWS